MSIGLEQQVAGPETQVDYAGDREGGLRVAVAATEPWFLLGRLDGREFRVVRADRLAAIIGPDYREWWLYSDETFDSKLSAALALTDILDPAGRRQKPRASLLVLEHDLGAALARLQPTQREAMAATIDFTIDRILLPFAETTSFDSWRATDRDEGKPWTGEDFDYGIDLLRTLQALLEVKSDTPIIIIGSQLGAYPGGDCGGRSDRAD